MTDTVPESLIPLPQKQSYELTLLGDVDVGRFFSREMPAESRSVSQRSIASLNPAHQEARLAVIPVSGVLTKSGSSYGVSTMELAATVTALANSGTVDGIALWIDSPGGEAAFVYDAIDAIRAANQKVPVHAYISDLGASAGYAIASACARISINEQGSAGCIGTYIAVQDWSAYMNKLGVKTYLIAAEGGTYKGLGTFGTELTTEQQDYLKQRADSLNQLFLKSVAIGRRMTAEQVLKLADGRVHIGQDALKLGLVDAVCSIETSLSTLAMSAKPRIMGQKLRSNQKETFQMTAATYQELKAALPKASAEFLCQQQEIAADVPHAQAAWTQHLEQQLADKDQKLTEANAAKQKSDEAAALASATKPKMPGLVVPKSGDEATTGRQAESAVAEYHSLIRERMKSLGCMRMKAVAMVNRERPELHQAFLLATNPHSNVQKKINSKFEIEAAHAAAS